MDKIQLKKQKLRQEAKNLRKTFDTVNLSALICENIQKLPEYKSAQNILAFHPTKYETDLQALFHDNTKNWYLPKVTGDSICVCPLCDDLCLGCFNILEPTGMPVKDLSIIDLVFVPALLSDKNGFRLGYGKGYYDRFLPMLNATRVIPIFDELITEQDLPTFESDRSCDIVISEKRFIRPCQRR